MPLAVTYHCWSALTDPAFIVILYCPALSVVVCVTWWKLDWSDSLRHSTTVAPATGVPVSPPEITTFRPAVEGSGEAAIVRALGVHAVVQHVVPVGQHVVPVVQHVDVAGQHVLFEGYAQHGMNCGPLGVAPRGLACAPLTGYGQHVCCPCGQRMWGTLRAAPAGLGSAVAHSKAARQRSDDGTIRRRIAETPGTLIPGFVKPNAALKTL